MSIYKKLSDAIEEAQGDEEVTKILSCAMQSYLTLLENRNNEAIIEMLEATRRQREKGNDSN